MGRSRLSVGTAGWNIRSEHREAFPPEGSHLERYAARFNAVEINSSFYRPHRRTTYERWAATVGDDFQFAVKLPKAISHSGLATGSDVAIGRFADEAGGLGDKLGVVLVQFSPSLAFHHAATTSFFDALARRLSSRLACEPRHDSWFTGEADELLARREIARVAADPAIVPIAALPGGWPGLRYHRLHGSPDIYRSEYTRKDIDMMQAILTRETSEGAEAWCILDNTALGFATTNALLLRNTLPKVDNHL